MAALFKRGGNIVIRQSSNEISSVMMMKRCMSCWKVFVAGLGPDTTVSRLQQDFSKFGKVTQAEVALDTKSGRCSGYGFVTFAKSYPACNAMETLDNWEYRGHTVTLDWAKETRKWMKDDPEDWNREFDPYGYDVTDDDDDASQEKEG